MNLKYVAWREGRPRFTPGPRERALGFTGEDLKSPTGTWFNRTQAKEWVEAKLLEIQAARSGKPAKAAGVDRTIGRLLLDWMASDEVAGLAVETRRSYTNHTNAVLYKPGTLRRRCGGFEPDTENRPEPNSDFALEPVDNLGPPELRTWFNWNWKHRGPTMAHAMLAMVSAAWTWGRESKWRLGPNPRLEMKFKKPDGRIRVWTFDEFDAMVAAADELDRASLGDMFYLGLWTGQRQTDRRVIEDGGLETIGGVARRKFRQSKTGKVVRIKDVPALAARLEAARKRRLALSLKHGTRHTTIAVCERDGRPYGDYNYYHQQFERVKALAAKRVPSCADLRDQDLRDTCVTMLDMAGVDVLSICDITGHSYASVQLIRKHYLGNNVKRADAAMDKFVKFVTEGRAA